ncbi:hypothetical protein ACG1BZ_09290 [Microbulbifer sp. CNSA002]|uniref:hypothetical protein n=1 Tax=Microbulbifer sp. CNSA002 TaxID=3373604 RepID=UPI0039B647FA
MRIVIATIFSLFFIASTARADSLKRADKEDIEMLLSAASGNNSAYWASYIGNSRGRVYIQYESAVHSSSLFTDKMSHVIYWIPESELSAKELAKFVEYKNRYEPAK